MAPPWSSQHSAGSRGRTTAPPCWPASWLLHPKIKDWTVESRNRTDSYSFFIIPHYQKYKLGFELDAVVCISFKVGFVWIKVCRRGCARAGEVRASMKVLAKIEAHVSVWISLSNHCHGHRQASRLWIKSSSSWWIYKHLCGRVALALALPSSRNLRHCSL